MESENQDSSPPELPPRTSRKINLNEALAKTISSELNSRLSSIRTSGSAATPSRISGVQYNSNAPPMPPRRDDSDDILDDYAEDDKDDAPPPLPPKRANGSSSAEDLEDLYDNDLPPKVPPRGGDSDDLPPPIPPRGGDSDDLPPPPPPRGAEVRVSDESLDEYELPEDLAPPPLPARNEQRKKDEEEEKEEEEINPIPPKVPARTYHHIEVEEEEEKPAPVKDNASAKEIKELKEQIEELEQEIKDKNEVISDMKTDYNRLCGEIKILKENQRSSDDKIKKLKQENETLKSDNEKLKKEYEKLKKESEELKKENEDLSKRNKQLKIDTGSVSSSKASSPSKTSPNKSASPTKGAPAIPPKPSKKVCENMIQSASAIDNDEYDFGSPKDQSSPQNESQDNNDSSNNVEFLPGSSSRPLVLPTKSCVRKRGNRLSSAITERKSSKKITSTLMEEPVSEDIDSPPSATSPVDAERKLSGKKSSMESPVKKNSVDSTKSQTPVVPPKPQLPRRSTDRKTSTGSAESSEYRKNSREESPRRNVKNSVVEDDGDGVEVFLRPGVRIEDIMEDKKEEEVRESHQHQHHRHH